MMNPKISILIPFYNGGELFNKTIQSILDQSFTDYEVICIDDFSNDTNKNNLKKWCDKDARIKVIHRDVKGGTAVKGIVFGLPFCKGDYFFFMSQDDLIDIKCLEILYEKAIETNADIVVPDMIRYYEDGKDHGGIFAPNNNYDVEISGELAFKLSLDWSIHGFGLKKMSHVRKVGYDDFLFNSDEYGSRTQYLNADKVVFSKAKFYYRQDNENAITHKGIKPLYKIEYGSTDFRLLQLIRTRNINCFKEEWRLFKGCCAVYWRCHSKKILDSLDASEKEKCMYRLDELKRNLLDYSLKYKRLDFLLMSIIIAIKGMFDHV